MKEKKNIYEIGDTLILRGTGDFFPGVECIIVAISEDGRHPTKLKAVVADERLGRHGFIEENGEYYAVEWHWSDN